MSAVVPGSFTDECLAIVARAQVAGMVPVEWRWGPNVCAEFKALLDKHPTVSGSYAQDWATQTKQIAEYFGLPVFPMVAQGIALRTVPPQS